MPRKKSTTSDAYPEPTAKISSDNTRDRWQIKDALSTLTRAEEIKRDKGLMRDVKVEARKLAKAVDGVVSGGRRKK